MERIGLVKNSSMTDELVKKYGTPMIFIPKVDVKNSLIRYEYIFLPLYPHETLTGVFNKEFYLNTTTYEINLNNAEVILKYDYTNDYKCSIIKGREHFNA